MATLLLTVGREKMQVQVMDNAPMTCEPPPESRDVRWHWICWMDEDPRPVSWGGYVWHSEELRRTLSPVVAGEMGYRYIAPIPMPSAT